MLLKHERIDGQLCTPSHSVLSSIGRLAEPYTPGFDVWSLVQLLEDMRRAAEAFGRSEIGSLFDASDAPSYEGELRDFLAESMWKNAGDVDSGVDRLRARQMKEVLLFGNSSTTIRCDGLSPSHGGQPCVLERQSASGYRARRKTPSD